MVKCENYKASIKGLSAEDFPLIPKIKEKPILYFKKAGSFKKCLITGSWFGGSFLNLGQNFPEFYLNLNKENVKLVATDSFRLAEKIIYQESINGSNRIINYSPKNYSGIIRIVSEKPDEQIKIILGESQILFEMEDIQLISRLIEGQYPDYQQIIPKNFETKIVVQKR